MIICTLCGEPIVEEELADNYPGIKVVEYINYEEERCDSCPLSPDYSDVYVPLKFED